MEKPRFTRAMWLILIACVATVTFIAEVFGLKVLIAFVAVVSLVSLVIDKIISNGEDKG